MIVDVAMSWPIEGKRGIAFSINSSGSASEQSNGVLYLLCQPDLTVLSQGRLYRDQSSLIATVSARGPVFVALTVTGCFLLKA